MFLKQFAAAGIFYFHLMVTASSEASKSCNAVLRLHRNVDNEHRLRSRVIESQPISRPFECYLKCLENCRCLSYNLCNGGKLCELNSARRENDTFFYDKSDECDYHDFNFHERQSNNCHDPCCTTSQACLNGGRCRPTCMENGRRFQCLNCSDGYSGDRCEVLPRSCNSYRQSSNHTHGRRLVYAPDNTSYYVFCRFGKTNILTLVMSFSRNNMQFFQNQSLRNDYPVSENSPNFVKYRLSYNRMVGLQAQSRSWRYTCMYDNKLALNSGNKLRASFDSLDPLVFDSDKYNICSKVEEIRIDGKGCVNCYASVAQGQNLVHVTAEKTFQCDDPWTGIPDKKCSNGKTTRYFGDYVPCYDPKFECTSSGEATTQFWFIASLP